MIVYFNSINPYKWEEVELIAKEFPQITVKRLEIAVTEVISLDLIQVGKAKMLEVFEKHQVPLFVEHGALAIEYLGGLPGPLSKPFWDTLGNDLCRLIPPESNRSALASSIVCYTNGRQIATFSGELRGHIAEEMRGSRMFQWDPIFIPEDMSITLAEMSVSERSVTSQASQAYRRLFESLISTSSDR